MRGSTRSPRLRTLKAVKGAAAVWINLILQAILVKTSQHKCQSLAGWRQRMLLALDRAKLACKASNGAIL